MYSALEDWVRQLSSEKDKVWRGTSRVPSLYKFGLAVYWLQTSVPISEGFC